MLLSMVFWNLTVKHSSFVYTNNTSLLLKVSWLEEETVYGKFKSYNDIQIQLRM